MASLTPNEFLDWLVQNQFLSEGRAQPFRSPPAQYVDAAALARDLIGRNWLTPFQRNQILQGRGEDLILGPYHLLDRVGEGAMGQVFKGWNPKLERLSAIKMIHQEHLANKKATERFRREIHAASQLEHPNIVRVYDADEVENRRYLVMEFVDGTDLSQLVKQGGPLPVWQAAEYARQAALGLQHAHERGVVHRDIKPGNLLVTRDKVVKILDFGLARFETDSDQEGRLTTIGAMLGTVDYIAPEQAANAKGADIRADIYSLGCTLFFFLAGRAPFLGATIEDKLSARMTGEPPSIRAVRAEVPPGLDAVLTRMLARLVADRFQTPHEVALALQPFCDPQALGGGIAPVAPLVGQAAPADMPVAPPVAAAASTSPGPPFARGGIDGATPIATTSSPPLAKGAPAVSSPPLAKGGFGGGEAPDPFDFSQFADPAPPAAAAVPTATALPASPVPGIPVRGKPLMADKRLLALYTGGGLVVVVLFFFLIRGCGGSKDVYPPGASLEISPKEKVMTFDLNSSKSPKKYLVVLIKRNLFQGPVTLSVEGLPKGVKASNVIIDEKKQAGAIPITVSYGIASLEKEVRVVATAKNLKVKTALSLKVIGAEAPEP